MARIINPLVIICLFCIYPFHSFELPNPSDLADTIKSSLLQSGLGSIGRTMSVGSGMTGMTNLLTGGLDRLGYIPVGEALEMCEGQGRWRLEKEIDRLRKEGEKLFQSVGSDLEARCRGYVGYAAEQCTARVNSLAQELERQGRSLLGDVQGNCMRDTIALAERTTEEEERRLRGLGDVEQARLRSFYEEEGKVEEKKVIADFEQRGKELEQTIRKEYELRGKEETEKATREFELRGEVERVTIELELRKRGEGEAIAIRKEFEDRGAELEGTITKEFEDRGAIKMKEIEAEFIERGRKLQQRGEEQCTDMINMACEDVVEGTESEDFCEEFLFFTQDLEKRKRRKRLGFSQFVLKSKQP